MNGQPPTTSTMIDEKDHKPALLIVDSDPVVLRTTGRAMERRGFAPVLVASLGAAREVLPASSPRFAIIEQRVSDGSGLDLIADVKRARSGARVVVLTSFGSVEHAVAAARLGADDYLMKPIDANSIAAALRDGGVRLEDSRSFPHPGQQELNYLLTVYEQHNRNMSESARAIGMHRRTLQRILRRHGIAPGNTQALPAPGHVARLRRLYRLWTQLLETGVARLAPMDEPSALHDAAE